MKRGSNAREKLSKGEFPESLNEIEGKTEVIDFKGTMVQKPDDVYYCLTVGSSGYGDPLERDSESVLRDVLEGYVSLELAENIYGVVIDGKTLTLDSRATHSKRREISEKRGRLRRSYP
jgi:N-methylhydantoinase B